MVLLKATNSNLLTNALEILNQTAPTTEENKIKTETTYAEYIDKGKLLRENDYYTLAINEFTQASKSSPNSAEPYILIGETHLSTKNYDKALLSFQKALEKSPTNIDAITGIAQSYMHLNDFTEARKTVDSIVNPDSDKLKYYQGMLYFYDGEYDRSEEYFQSVADTSQDETLKTNAQLFLDAYAEYELEQGGQENHLRTLLAQAATETDQYELATSTLYQVLSETPTYRDAWILLGYAYLNLEAYEDSASAFEEAIELDTTKPETNYFLSLAYYGLDDYDNAIKYLDLSLLYGFEPQVQAYQKLAEIYFTQQDYEAAERNYEKILELNSTDVNYFIRPIWLNMEKLDDMAQAFDLANQALTTNPDNAMSYNLMGWVYVEKEDDAHAYEYLTKAIEMDPELGAAYLNLGTMYETQGDYTNAIENYKKAYNLDQNDSVGALAAQKFNNLLNQGLDE
ncbi:MAG: tetratricopeptide repeat protein [Candidatus Gracilibacteria bacterium]